MKRLYVPAILASLSILALSGCGVAQKQYDTALSEMNRLQSELSTAKEALRSANATALSLQAKLDAITTQGGNTNTELQSAKAKLQSTQDSLSKITATASTLNPKLDLAQKIILMQSYGYLSSQAVKDGNLDEQKRLDALVLASYKSFDAPVASIRDSELSRAWGEAWSTGARQQSETNQRVAISYVGVSKFYDRLAALLKTDADSLAASSNK